jgi:thymidylate synthase ThyX
MSENPPEEGFQTWDRPRHEYVDKAMRPSPPMEGAGAVPKVHLLWATPDPLGAIAAACRMYEGKVTYSLDDITPEERVYYWDQVFQTHLRAPLEFVKFHFFIEAVTRSFTHQMVRQRTAVYAQESLRFAVKENLEIWVDMIQEIQDTYNLLISRGIPAEDARGLLPHATTTRLNYCTDLRNLLEVAGNRLCTQAAFEWRAVFAGIMSAIRQYRNFDYTAWQFEMIGEPAAQTFAPICYRKGSCPFMAVFDRDCIIRARVNSGRWDEIDPKEWMLDPTAGRRSE